MALPCLKRKRHIERSLASGCSNGLRGLVRRTIVDGQPRRNVHTQTFEELSEVGRPCNCDGDIPDSVFNDEIPADDPRYEFTERGI